jgi:hypothetical protein
MKNLLIAVLFILLIPKGNVFAQSRQTDIRMKSFISFLVKEQELENTADNYHNYKDAIHYSIIFSDVNCAIYVINTFSPHGRKYIALQKGSNLTFLESNDLNSDLKLIVLFLKKNKEDNAKLLKFLNYLTDAYEYNMGLKALKY